MEGKSSACKFIYVAGDEYMYTHVQFAVSIVEKWKHPLPQASHIILLIKYAKEKTTTLTKFGDRVQILYLRKERA